MDSSILKVNNEVSFLNDYSLSIRFEEISFYIGQLYENFFFGMGFIPFNVSSYTDFLLRGPYAIYYKSDIGILGFLNIFGILGFLWLILLFFKIIKIASYSVKVKGSLNKNYELLSLVIFVILSSLSLSIFDIQRIIAVPILLALLDYLFNMSNNSAN
ncbi:hypothetical protein A499_13316 [Niallia nealsonii AAU1]|nr:hypothetical protein A499_13316 [Niallia nealsonii AAU1]